MTTQPELLFLRRLIDNMDRAIVSVLVQRSAVIEVIQAYKQSHQVETTLSDLRQTAVAELLDFAQTLSLDKQFVSDLFNQLYQDRNRLFLQSDTPPVIKEAVDTALPKLNRTLKHLDMSFCCLLAERMQLVQQVGEFKLEHHIAVLDKTRWQEVLASKKALAESFNINPAVIEHVFERIHQQALQIESNR